MLDDDTLLRLTMVAEKASFVFFPSLLVLPWLTTRRHPRVELAGDRPEERVTRSETALLLLVLAGALVLRVVWWDRGIPGTIYGGEVISARVDLALQRGGLWARWWELLRSVNLSGWLWDSAIIEPVVVGFQMIFGPRIHGIVLVGAFFGVVGVGLAWLAGRLLHGPRFGLLFAGLIAVSPLQVVWSRLGYRAMAATPHVLLAVVLAALAARRGSWVLAALAGTVSYATVYSYEAARTAIPLAFLTLWVATRGSVRRLRRFTTLSAVVSIVILALAITLPRATLKEALWPRYPGYAGNQGERSVREFIERNYSQAKGEAVRSLADYFVVSRNSPPRPLVWSWGIAYGGLAFLPVIIAGAVGILAVLGGRSRGLLWFAFLLLGLALPALGRATARRMLVFDLGWCAFASLGLVALRTTPLLSRLSRPYPSLIAGIFLAAMGTWTLAAMVLLRTGPSSLGVYQVPFANGFLHDIPTCDRCVEAAKMWEADIRDGNLVVLIDSDLGRETPTGPAGLPLYGYLAAATAGARDRFQELYPILWNVNFSPEVRHYYAIDGQHAKFFRDFLSAMPYREIVWHDERPNGWDRGLAARLAAAGGRLTTFSTPLGNGPGFRVVTTKAQEPAVLDVLSSLGGGPDATPSCVSATSIKSDPLPFAAHAVVSIGQPAGGEPPAWMALSWDIASVSRAVWPLPAVRQVMVDSRTAHVLRRDGYAETYRWPSLERTGRKPLTQLTPIGRACAAFAADDWWVVDPVRGVLSSATPHDWIPNLTWVGLGTNGREELVLVAAEHRIVVVDLLRRVVAFEFPAPITPSRVEEFGECSQLARGAGWIGVLHQSSNRLDVYADPGRRLGSLDLTRVGAPWTRAVAARGDFLAAGRANQDLTTLRLDFGRCAIDAQGETGAP